VILERETRLEVEGFTTNWPRYLLPTVGVATLTDFCLPTRLKDFRDELRNLPLAEKKGVIDIQYP
jgi:hypothetical protein